MKIILPTKDIYFNKKLFIKVEVNIGRYSPCPKAVREIFTFTNAEVKNCFSIFHTYTVYQKLVYFSSIPKNGQKLNS